MSRGPDCPVDVTLGALGGRWIPLIMLQFLHGEHSRRELGVALPQVPEVELNSRLVVLTTSGLLRRIQLHGEPPRVIYRLTGRGAALLPVLDAMWEWGAVDDRRPPAYDFTAAGARRTSATSSAEDG